MNGQTDKTIAPIQTRYKGYHFRSRLEARWAVFFDEMGIKWEYEKEGYDIDGRYYLPDFWLTDYECFVEIKPTLKNDYKLYARFFRKVGNAIVLFEGPPWEYTGWWFGFISAKEPLEREKFECVFTPPFKEESTGIITPSWLVINDDWEDHISFNVRRWSGNSLSINSSRCFNDGGKVNFYKLKELLVNESCKIQEMNEKAKSARFEYKECGVT